MKSKSFAFKNFVYSTMHPVYVLIETWFEKGILNNEFFPPQYNIYRRDRKENPHGGVLIAVKSSIKSFEIDNFNDNIECLSIKLFFENVSLVLYAAYIPPGESTETYNSHANNICNIVKNNTSENICILGDFNLSKVQWLPDDSNEDILVPSNFSNYSQCSFTDSLLSLNLYQINGVLNMNGRLLDLVFFNDCAAINVFEAIDAFISKREHHCGLEITVDFGEIFYESIQVKEGKVFNFNLANIDGLNDYLSNFKWDLFLRSSIKIEDQLNTFYNIMFDAFELFIPKFRVKSKSMNTPPWFNDSLSSLRNRKNRASRVYKKFPSVENHQKFQYLYSEFNDLLKTAHSNYIKKIENQLTVNPKYFWSYINNIRKSRGYPAAMFFGDTKSTDPQIICNLFADFFQSVYSVFDEVQNDNISCSDVPMNIGIPFISHEDILDALSDFGQGSGEDGIPAIILIKLSTTLAPPLQILFNNSLRAGIFPNKWKKSHIIPIFKKGKRADISNYRGISILSPIPKLFEKIVTKHLYFHTSNRIAQQQHGFCKKKSTTTNLMELVTYCTKVFEDKMQLDVIYTDFSKAFDSINHDILLNKLSCFGLSPNFLAWVKSYLSNRVQYVLLNGYKSKPISVYSGVPQGSHLGPLLFILFINDLVDVLKYSECLLYADDAKIFKKVGGLSDATELQLDINAVTDWCKLNLLHLNVSKCSTMTYYRIKKPIVHEYCIGNRTLNRIEKITDLGITFEHNLTYNKHIDAILAKSNMILGLLIRASKSFCGTIAITTLFTSLIRSILEYGVVIWNNTSQKNCLRIERVQKKFTRYCFFKLKWPFNPELPYWQNQINLPPYVDRCQTLQLDCLYSRRNRLCAQFIADLISARIDCSGLLSQLNFNVPAHFYRRYQAIYLEGHNTMYGKNAPLAFASKIFNESYSECFDFNLSKSQYKNNLNSV